MKKTIERERTYLAKQLPFDLEKHPCTEIMDLYVPKNSEHAKLRIRMRGGSYVITKKNPVNENDPSIQIEQNIKITKNEFEALSKSSVDIIHKLRFEYPYLGYTAEIDVFMDKLKGLVLVDVEFTNKAQLTSFKIPDFCLAEVTNEHYLAGGVLCKETISSLRSKLNSYKYKKLCLKKEPILTPTKIQKKKK